NRHKETPVTPGHRLVDLERLAATGTNALRVEVEQRGDLTELPQALEAALYRVAQESVTNAQRHAQSATRVAVTVTGNGTEVQLTVVDDGSRATSPDPPGYGLIGMTERITLLGGTLQAGPAPDRGWCIRAVLPRPRRAT
ncbi:MAG TPA: ATP-binding protein, partial [Propionibacteriaceae bacterium]